MPRRIRSRPLTAWRDPEAVFRARFAEAPYAVWLDGGADAARASASSRPRMPGASSSRRMPRRGTVTRSDAARRGRRRVDGRRHPCSTCSPNGSRSAVDPVRRASRTTPAAAARRPLGWFGWFGYELGARLNDVAASPAETPDAAFLFVDRAIVFDHGERTVRLAWLEPDGADAAGDRERRGPRSSPRRSRGSPRHPRQRLADAAHRAATDGPTARVRAGATTPSATPSSSPRARPRSRAGDAYQLCLTNRVDVDVRPDPAVDLPRAARVEPEPPRRLPAVRRRRPAQRVARAVPRRSTPTGSSRTQPIKGTRPRGADAAADAALAARAARQREGARREPHDRRPDAQRPRRASASSARSACRACSRSRATPQVHQLVSTVRARLRHRLDRGRRRRRVLPGRIDDRGAEAAAR